MRWCRNLYAPLVQGSVRAGHPEPRQKRPSVSLQRLHMPRIPGGGWTAGLDRILPCWTIVLEGGLHETPGRPGSPTLPSGATSGPLCAELGTKIWRGSSTLEPPRGFFLRRLARFRSMGLTGPSLRRRISLGGARDRSATHPRASRRMWIRRSARITGARLPEVPGRLLQMLSSIRFDP
jgi:hypothetical protein